MPKDYMENTLGKQREPERHHRQDGLRAEPQRVSVRQRLSKVRSSAHQHRCCPSCMKPSVILHIYNKRCLSFTIISE